MSDEELLRETVEFVTGDAGFRQRRTAFVEWQQRFLRGGVTDRDSIARAVTEVQDLLEDAKKATAKLRLRKIARYAFQIARVGVSLGLAAAGVPEGLKTAAEAFFFSLGGIVVEEAFFKGAEQGLPPPIAFVYDARRQFGWE